MVVRKATYKKWWAMTSREHVCSFSLGAIDPLRIAAGSAMTTCSRDEAFAWQHATSFHGSKLIFSEVEFKDKVDIMSSLD